jgi:CBS domain-containing protein
LALGHHRLLLEFIPEFKTSPESIHLVSRSIDSMSSERSDSQKPSVAVAKTTPSTNARQDSVSLMETDDYVCIEPSAPLYQAIAVMKRDEGGCAIVCGKDRSVVGIFTERDLLNKIVGQSLDMAAPVSNWMSPVVATLGPEATIGEAVAIMNEKGHRNIPLVKDGKLVGSISVFDVISYLAESYPKSTINLPPNSGQVMDTTDGG